MVFCAFVSMESLYTLMENCLSFCSCNHFNDSEQSHVTDVRMKLYKDSDREVSVQIPEQVTQCRRDNLVYRCRYGFFNDCEAMEGVKKTGTQKINENFIFPYEILVTPFF